MTLPLAITFEPVLIVSIFGMHVHLMKPHILRCGILRSRSSFRINYTVTCDPVEIKPDIWHTYVPIKAAYIEG